MTIRCVLCGEAESEETVVLRTAEVCYSCIESLVENEIERRGEARDASALANGCRTMAEFQHRMTEAQNLKR
jgi:hypothetical protein